MDEDKGAMRLRAIAGLALAVETSGDVDQAVQAPFMAEVEPSEIVELRGLRGARCWWKCWVQRRTPRAAHAPPLDELTHWSFA
jgi:hypothetical protein